MQWYCCQAVYNAGILLKNNPKYWSAPTMLPKVITLRVKMPSDVD